MNTVGRLIAGAKSIADPNGAGLSDLAFTNPGANVVELTNGYDYKRCFEWVCHVSGHTYNKFNADALMKPLRANQLANMILAYA